MRVSSSPLDGGQRTTNEDRRASSPARASVATDPGEKKVQLVEHRLGSAEQNLLGGSLMNLSSPPSYRSCIHRQVPPRSTCSVVLLDKTLSISLTELKGRRAGRPTLYKSTLSVGLGVSYRGGSSTDPKWAKTNGVYQRPRAAAPGRNGRADQERAPGHRSEPLSKEQGREVEQTAAHTNGNDGNAGESNTRRRRSSALGLLSFKGPSPCNTKAGRLKGNADEAAVPSRSNLSHRLRTLNIGPVDSRIWSEQTVTDNTGVHRCPSEAQRVSTLDMTCYYHSRLRADSQRETPATLSLKEALELFRPDFISRSQGRMRRLEHRARRRRALQDSNPDLTQDLREDGGKQRRNCTTPDPLSDNLFKPRERSISGREMQLRSRRIYNMLPEVTKKKEEERKRAVSQTNRLRAEVFKKRLLDQILQR